MKRVLFATIIVFIAGPGAASAQRIDSPYRFLEHNMQMGVYAGRISAEEGVLRIGPQPAPTFGARWAARVSGPLTLGVELGYTPTTRTVRDTVFVAADSLFESIGEADVRMLSVMGNVQFGITGARTWYGLHPFLLAGGGVIMNLAGSAEVERDLATTARYDAGTRFAGQLGGGVHWYPTQRLSVRLDARNVLWRVGAPEAFRRTQAGTDIGIGEGEWEGNFALTAGLSIHF
jgi:hypothetical protein